MANISKIKIANNTYSITCPWVTCATAAATQAKTVSITGATLAAGTQLNVKFINGNSHASPTLNVNSLGAKNIVGNSMCAPSKYSSAGSIMHLLYDGTSWIIIG